MSDLDWLLDHSESPYHRGIPESSEVTMSGTLASQVCADRVVLGVTLDNDRIREIWHEAEGCMVSQAAASYVCEWGEGATIHEIMECSESDYLKQLGELTPRRQPCALQAFRCLKRMLGDDHSASGNA